MEAGGGCTARAYLWEGRDRVVGNEGSVRRLEALGASRSCNVLGARETYFGTGDTE